MAVSAPDKHTSDQPKRIQLRRTKGWRKPEGAIVVARPSRWGNPFVVGEWVALTGDQLGTSVGHYDPSNRVWFEFDRHRMTPEEAVDFYRRDLEWVLEWDEDEEVVEALAELRGHDLACWCPLDRPCHADVLLDLANR